MVLKLAGAAIGLSGGSLLGAATTAPGSSLSLGEITQLIIAVTGLIAAISAFVIGIRSRRDDPRDKLLETLLREREEARGDVELPEPAPKRSRGRRRG